MTLRVHPDEIVAMSPSPLLRIHDSWGRVRLGDVANVQNGFAFKSTEFSTMDGMPLIRIRDVGASTTAVRYSGEYATSYVVEPGTIIVGMDGDFRAARWTGPPALLNQRVCTIKVRTPDSYDEDFLLYVLPGYLEAINAVTSAVTVKHLSSETIKDVPLPLPPLAEQRRIVAAIEENLSRLDAADAEVRSAKARLDLLRRSVLEAAVHDGRDAALDDLLVRIEAGRSAGGPAPPAREDEWGVIKVSAMTWGEFRPGENKHVAPDSVDPRHEIRAGDLLVSRANTTEYVGAAVLVRETRPRLALSDKSLRLIVRDGVDREWLLYALLAPSTRSQISAGATGTSDSMRNISQEKLRAVRLRVPSAQRQAAIAAEISRKLGLVADLAATAERTLRKSTAMRRSILARAVGGELAPQDATDEPARVLLERITAERAAAPRAGRRVRTPA